jgi:formamidopyrimidine-DNA glycosylase
MPELPEVQTIINDHIPIIPGQTIQSAAYTGNLGQELRRKSRIDLSVSLAGKKIIGVERLAKQVIVGLDSGEYLLIHLKITGRLLLRQSGAPEDEFTRLVIKLSDGQELRFTDRNGFADCYIITDSELDQHRVKYGPEAVGDALTEDKFMQLITNSTKPSLKETLLDQKIISGVGNIYADEALFLAKLHPQIKPKQITSQEAATLLGSIRQVLNEGLRDRGTTIDSYLDAFGRPGHHQDNLRVYGRRDQACLVCGGTVEYTEVGGRRTYFCPSCQKLPQLSLF